MIRLSLVKIISVFISLFLFACEKAAENSTIKKPSVVTEHQQANTAIALDTDAEKPQAEIKEALPASAFMQAEWTDLIPEDDLDALLNPPSYLDEIADGSAEDTLSNNLKNEIENTTGDRYQQALTSTRVKAVINNAPIRIPAFIVPLEFDDDQKVTQFFMVPFFGACLHLPPPPPNQTIFVNYPPGIKLESLYNPYWISGIIKTSLVENDTATAAYTMDVHAFELYVDEFE